MADRRRVNGPAGVTTPPVFVDAAKLAFSRKRPLNGVRGLFLKTGVTPSASGSAYLEVEAPRGSNPSTGNGSGMKIVCSVHGPRALPRSSPFSPQLVLTAHVKYAPFATRQRRGYLRDSSERDLGVHLETALGGAIIADRWPKSGVDVIVTIIEGDQERREPFASDSEEWDMMNVLGGCITVASAALVDAGIDCVDTVSGGIAAVVPGPDSENTVVVDPVASEHESIAAACCVAYLPSRDEITNLWVKGQIPTSDPLVYARLVGQAVQAAKGSHKAIIESLSSTVEPAT